MIQMIYITFHDFSPTGLILILCKLRIQLQYTKSSGHPIDEHSGHLPRTNDAGSCEEGKNIAYRKDHF